MKKVKLEIAELDQDSTLSQPILACFPQNIPKTELAKKEMLNFELYENLLNSDQKMLVGQSEYFTYTGKNFGEYSLRNSYQNNYIGIKEGDVMKLYKIDTGFNLKQKLKNTEKLDKEEEETVTKNLSLIEQKQNLVEAFGTKKSRKKIQQQQNSIVKVTNISQSEEITELFKYKGIEMEKKVEEEKTIKNQELIKQKKSFLPQFNLQTEEPSDIYNISSSLKILKQIQYQLHLKKNQSNVKYNQ